MSDITYQRTSIAITILGATVGAIAFAGQASAVSMYVPIDIGISRSSGDIYRVTAINNFGQIVSYTDDAFGRKAFIWDRIKGKQNLKGVGETSFAYDINNLGQVIGLSSSGTFIWNKANDLQYLPSNFFSVDGINDLGQVVGQVDFSNNLQELRAVLWEQDKGIQNLGVLDTVTDPFYSESPNSFASDINNLGQVVGRSTSANGPRAFLWEQNSGMQNLGVLGTDARGFSNSFASDINDLGQVVGLSSIANGSPNDFKAFLWEKDKGMRDLGVLGIYRNGFVDSRAHAINNIGQIVGTSSHPRFQSAFLWEKGKMYNLNKLIVGDFDLQIYEAQDINDRGQIVAYALDLNNFGGIHTFLLNPVDLPPDPTPVPEPLTLLGAGTAIGFGAFFKRKLAKKSKTS